MIEGTMYEKIDHAIKTSGGLICLGLDYDPDLAPGNIHPFTFLMETVKATRDVVAAYKINPAFFQSFVPKAAMMDKLLEGIETEAPDAFVIMDVKYGDIENTNRHYAKGVFEMMHGRIDACTVNPYMGIESLLPFLEYEGKGMFVLTRTTERNELQSLPDWGNKLYAYEKVAAEAMAYNSDNIGLVVSGRHPKELETMRKRHPEAPFLVPGIGKQGGDSIKAGQVGGRKSLFASSRSMLYDLESDDIAFEVRYNVLAFRDAMNMAMQ